MFYCDACATKNDWPLSSAKSKGACEDCGQSAICNNVPSSRLPIHPAYRPGGECWEEYQEYVAKYGPLE